MKMCIDTWNSSVDSVSFSMTSWKHSLALSGSSKVSSTAETMERNVEETTMTIDDLMVGPEVLIISRVVTTHTTQLSCYTLKQMINIHYQFHKCKSSNIITAFISHDMKSS